MTQQRIHGTIEIIIERIFRTRKLPLLVLVERGFGVAFGSGRRNAVLLALLLHLQKVLLSMGANLDHRLGTHVSLDLLPIALVKLQSLHEAMMLLISPALSRLRDRVLLPLLTTSEEASHRPTFLLSASSCGEGCGSWTGFDISISLVGFFSSSHSLPRAKKSI
jgi:hypothetical protein